MLMPMCIDSGDGGLKYSCHNSEHDVSADIPRQHSDQAAPEPENERLKSLKTIFFNLAAARKTEKALEAAVAFIEAAEARIIALKRRVNDASRNNSNENIINIIRT